MKRITFLRLATLASFAPGMLLIACKDNQKKKAAEAGQKTYTCPMHPQIVQDKPGSCPICGMDLVIFDKSNKDASITLGESQIALANITTMTMGSGLLSNSKRLNGRLAVNPDQTAVVSSRVAGRIQVLYIKETGVPVRKGQALYKIYSEQLSALQQEYLLAYAQLKQFPSDTRFGAIEKAARQKLRLYDQSEEDIQGLTASQKQEPYITYRAPISGTVSELSVTEGQYVSEGSAILRLEDYSSLWVEADIYPAEAASIRTGQKVQVQVTGWEDKPQPMRIDFIVPAIQSGSQLMQVRGTVPNPGSRWQPGLQANLILPIAPSANAMTLPVDAVIRDAKGAHVWVETKPGTFLARMVSTGIQNADMVEIKEGIAKDEKVVVTGAYLLYSEYVLKKGSDPMALHQHE
ncbi:efflux RND transporter periplasmic adaptor subunit [Dyadobacter sediminis]|uniref:Efflux RND transporter periplasmic adaptor subunit n=1 Tax=Dyadobacter sediminis TaxID=1493691 RepID=A0A5R9K6I2_9BACT|nr:efflux RND transporter periplasmic adaptor subunit [Dyadobacter sediminis]TLU89383.1 efflux RND transporter periplasmic adaptor subunit [Dyadobacter sediminis]GGC05857.1 RND transporter [Dyadobacter sediminis]